MSITANTVVRTTRDDHMIAWLTALAISIHLLESALPSPFPGFKPGLANIVTIIVLCQYGLKMAIWVTLLRVLIGSLLLGTFMSPTFMLSLSGAVATLLMLALASSLSQAFPVWALGAIGYSVLGAMTHISVQFYVAYSLFIQHEALLALLPILATTSLIFGAISGIVAKAVLPELEARR